AIGVGLPAALAEFGQGGDIGRERAGPLLPRVLADERFEHARRNLPNRPHAEAIHAPGGEDLLQREVRPRGLEGEDLAAVVPPGRLAFGERLLLKRVFGLAEGLQALAELVDFFFHMTLNLTDVQTSRPPKSFRRVGPRLRQSLGCVPPSVRLS